MYSTQKLGLPSDLDSDPSRQVDGDAFERPYRSKELTIIVIGGK